MTKELCDRCGQEIVHHKYAYIRHRSIYAKLTLCGLEEDSKDKDIDLCPNCEKLFLQWLKGEKK